jgi:hypothetical protein
MLRAALIRAVSLAALLAGGCSLYRDALPATPKNLDLFTPGLPRSMLLAEFGPPVRMEIRDGIRKDIFRFWIGSSPPLPIGQRVRDGALNVATFGLAEGPHPKARHGTQTVYVVTYNSEDIITQAEELNIGAIPLETGSIAAAPGGSWGHEVIK